jgi:hypothetical protein
MSSLRLWVMACQALAIATVVIRILIPANLSVSIHTSGGHGVEVLRLREFLPLALIAMSGIMASVMLARAFIVAAHR